MPLRKANGRCNLSWKERNLRKRRNSNDSGCGRMWSDLSEDILFLIFQLLSVVDFVALKAVCRSWRECVLSRMKDYLDSRFPMVVLTATNASRTCRFFNIFDQTVVTAKLPNFGHRYHLGVSCGYLMMQGSDRQLWMVNPLNGHQIEFPQVHYRCDNLILASLATPSHDIVGIAISCPQTILQVCRLGVSEWSVYKLDKPLIAANLTIFKGHAYVLTTDGRIWMLKLSPHLHLASLNVKNAPLQCHCLHLVASEEQMLMLCVFQLRRGIYRLDFTNMEWVRVRSLGDHALLLDFSTGYAMPNPGRWGGASNCIYHFRLVNPISITDARGCRLFSLDGRYMGSLPHSNRLDKAIMTPLWYHPRQGLHLDLLLEE